MYPENWLNNDGHARRFGYAVVVFLVLFGGLWVSCAPIESAALAPGVVQVEGDRKSVQHLEGGIVSEILVTNGEWVEAGQALVKLDVTRTQAELRILEGRWYNSRARVDRLQAERDGIEELSFSETLQKDAIRDGRASNAMASERALFSARQADLRGEIQVLKSQQLGHQLMLRSQRAVAESLQSEIVDLAQLLEEGYVDKQRIRELERAKARAYGQISDLEVAIDETELKILQMSKRFKTIVVDELTDTQEALHDLDQQKSAAKDRVKRSVVRAPVQGTVLSLRPNTIGSVVAPGDTIVEVVPRAAHLVVAAKLSPMDIDRVRVGQPAEVRFSVFKDAYLVSGTLIKLSADSLMDEGEKIPYYEAEIKLLEEDLYLLQGMALVPGMPAEVLIKTGERTMLGYLTSPMSRIFSRSLIED
jgi:epimerase transport system membrane fusion protein